MHRSLAHKRVGAQTHRCRRIKVCLPGKRCCARPPQIRGAFRTAPMMQHLPRQFWLGTSSHPVTLMQSPHLLTGNRVALGAEAISRQGNFHRNAGLVGQLEPGLGRRRPSAVAMLLRRDPASCCSSRQSSPAAMCDAVHHGNGWYEGTAAATLRMQRQKVCQSVPQFQRCSYHHLGR